MNRLQLAWYMLEAAGPGIMGFEWRAGSGRFWAAMAALFRAMHAAASQNGFAIHAVCSCAGNGCRYHFPPQLTAH